MGKAGKTAAAAKKAKKEDDPVPTKATNGSSGSIVERAKALLFGACIMAIAPKVKDLFQEASDSSAKASEEKATNDVGGDGEGEESKEDNGTTKAESNGTKEAGGGPARELFAALRGRLAWHNVLGLGEPETAEDARRAWQQLRELELDWGPRTKRRGNPGLDRIMENGQANLPQYLHLLLALMMLRALLFRSFFACLPWLVGYEVLSLSLPLTNLSMLPQVPLEQIPVKFRVAGTVALHALVWIFFLYEAIWRMYFFEKILVVGLFAGHAYAVRPKDK